MAEFDYNDKEQLREMVQNSVRKVVNEKEININEDVSDLSLNEQQQIQESIGEWAQSLKDWLKKRSLKGLGMKVLESEETQIRYFFVRNDQTRDYVALKYDGNRFEDRIEFSSIGELESFVSDLEDEGYQLLKRKSKIKNALRVYIRSVGIMNFVTFGIGIAGIAVLFAMGITGAIAGASGLAANLQGAGILTGIFASVNLIPGWLMVRYTGDYPDEPTDRPEDQM